MKKAKPDFSKPKPVSQKDKDLLLEQEVASIVGESVDGQNDFVEDVSSSAATPSAKEITSKRSSVTEKFFPDKVYYNLPLIVIAGRPNVGKSTLFNALTHTKRAITDPTPGVTRDPVEGTAFLDGKPVHLMDTGGYKLTRDTGTMEAVMDDLVVEKTIEMIKKADRILLLLDATEFTPEDEELIQRMRPYWNKMIAAVNKMEGGKNEQTAYNYMKFGFKELLFISATHGDNIPQLEKAMSDGLDFSRVTEGVEERPIRIAIVGKPNTGKSTLSNCLTHTDASIVSDYAGTTRDVVEGSFRYNGKDCQVLDTAGIRRKAKVKENIEYYSVNRAIKSLDECDIVFLMIDAQEGLQEQDKKIASLAYERGRGIIFVLNKWDTQDKTLKTLRTAQDNIRTMFGHMNWAPIVAISALNSDGIKGLMDTALSLYEQLNRKIDTASLNMALKDWIAKYPPPATKAIHFKVRYMTQTSINPVNFLIFATRPDNVPGSYVTYLKNRIRADLGFDQIPVQLEMKESRKKWEDREKDKD
jgi:GTP-binding protein